MNRCYHFLRYPRICGGGGTIIRGRRTRFSRKAPLLSSLSLSTPTPPIRFTSSSSSIHHRNANEQQEQRDSSFQRSAQDVRDNPRPSSASASVSSLSQHLSQQEEEDQDEGEEGVGVVEVGEGDVDLDSHLRTKLYPPESSPIIQKLYQITNLADLFSLLTSLEEITPLISSQSLVTVWDMQKLLFQLNSNFTPEKDVKNRALFAKEIRDHEVFNSRILNPLLSHFKELNDEALCASILSLRKLSYGLETYEELVLECLNRKETLSLTGLSRLSVCLKLHNLYGLITLSEFSPLILKYVREMKTDLDIRLVSILMRNSSKLLSSRIVEEYSNKLRELLREKKTEEGVINNLETVTLCKMFLSCYELGIDRRVLRDIGILLAPRCEEMQLMELLSMQKFLQGQEKEPYQLTQGLIKRNLRFIESCRDNPRLDLLIPINPTPSQKPQLVKLINKCMDENYFLLVQNVLHPLLRNLHIQDGIYDKYWNNVCDLVNIRGEDEEDGEGGVRRVVTTGKNYLSFCHAYMFEYRNRMLESVMRNRIQDILEDYEQGKLALTPSEYSTIFSYLIAFDKITLPLLAKLQDLTTQLKPSDLTLIAKSIDGLIYNNRLPPKIYTLINDASSLIEQETAKRLNSTEELAPYLRVISVVRKVKGDDSPIVDLAVERFLTKDPQDVREMKEICSLLMNGSYLYPEVIDKICTYVEENLDDMSPDFVDKVLGMTYTLGWESDFGALADSVEKHLNTSNLSILLTTLSLGFHRTLHPSLVNSIFTIDFLDHIDAEFKNSFGKAPNYIMKLRQNLMELNRLVCIEVPDANLPWFHGKFCEDLNAIKYKPKSVLGEEVLGVLNDVVGNVYERDVCVAEDYYYAIDFRLQFDENDRPIRPQKRKSFFTKDEVVKKKIAILLLPPTAFTKNIRNVKGGYKLKKRHLEILGYNVIMVDPQVWNSMAMSEVGQRERWMEKSIFSNGQ